MVKSLYAGASISYRDALITVDAELLLVRAADDECLDMEGSGNSEGSKSFSYN